jgi:hypothetical protein
LTGFKLNYANIIALTVLLGVGVAFKIYYIMAWRQGETDFLESPLTRAVFFSALLTGTAFGSLWLSSNPGMSSMGQAAGVIPRLHSRIGCVVSTRTHGTATLGRQIAEGLSQRQKVVATFRQPFDLLAETTAVVKGIVLAQQTLDPIAKAKKLPKVVLEREIYNALCVLHLNTVKQRQ